MEVSVVAKSRPEMSTTFASAPRPPGPPGPGAPPPAGQDPNSAMPPTAGGAPPPPGGPPQGPPSGMPNGPPVSGSGPPPHHGPPGHHGPPPGPTPNGYGPRPPTTMSGGPPAPANPHTIQRVKSGQFHCILSYFHLFDFQMLDENASLIKTISEYQNVGKHSETMQYQWTLHRNLMYLASVTDQPNLQVYLPVSFQEPPPPRRSARLKN